MKHHVLQKNLYMRSEMFSIAVTASLILLCSCGAKKSPSGGSELTVFAAASLTEAFEEIASEFEKKHDGTDILLNFAGSQSLRTQIQSGAQPGVFASANPKHVDILVREGLARSPVVFAENALVLAVTQTASKKVTTFRDLAKIEKLVLASVEVPAGAYADDMLRKAAASYGNEFATAVKNHVVSRENHVRQTLQKVVLGEADAAVVYATDAMAMGSKVVAIDIPDEFNITARYPVALLQESAQKQLGQSFIDFLLSKTGQEILRKHGFKLPATQPAAS